MVYVALSLVVIMGMFATVIDYGNLTAGWRTSQNVADTAAFAAAEAARTDVSGTITASQIADKVNPIIALYGYPASELTLSYLDSNNSPVTPAGAAFKVRAQIDHPVATNLAHSLIGGASASTMETTRSAALIGAGPEDAFYIMGGGSHTIFVNSSTSSLNLSGGGFYSNSTNINAFQVIAGTINVASPNLITEQGLSPCGLCFPAVQTVPAIPDPFRNVPTPTLAGPKLPDVLLSSGTLTINPGYYNTIHVEGGILTMNPGIYVISNVFESVLHAGTGGTINGQGVMIYFTCGGPTLPAACNDAGQNGASLNLSGGAFVLKAPGSGVYQGMLVFYDRHNTSAMTITMNPTASLEGSVYAILSTLTMAGNTDSSLFNSAFVIADLKITGNSTLTMSYGGGAQYQRGGASVGTPW